MGDLDKEGTRKFATVIYFFPSFKVFTIKVQKILAPPKGIGIVVLPRRNFPQEKKSRRASFEATEYNFCHLTLQFPLLQFFILLRCCAKYEYTINTQ